MSVRHFDAQARTALGVAVLVLPAQERFLTRRYDLGENNRTPDWHRANQRTPWVAETLADGTFSYPPGRGRVARRLRRLPQ